ncbi:fibrinogen-like protein A [Pecten maximus]|uniref:fibrinogen-like protein A n=1 Tax=Pecten maximus TaxID=6579 RepID=UPI001458F4F6|nr:fibrinogen-like protein A [Pecten maximus]
MVERNVKLGTGPSDCADVNPGCSSIVHKITTATGKCFDIYCDMDSDQGHWNVIHNRGDSSVDFYRNWNEYKTGFGDVTGNFWLGNENIYSMMVFSRYKLRIELEAWGGTVGIVEYSLFKISSEADNYRLTIGGFSGTTSDAMDHVNGQMFSTKDRDNDETSTRNCAVYRHGAWWYRACAFANLNGRYTVDTGNSKSSMYWKFFFAERSHVPMKKARMMIKRY